MCYRQQSSFWNWILFFVKRNTSHKSCHSFLDISLWAPKVCKNQAWVLGNHGYKLDRKICWFDLPMPILFPMNICFQFFWEKLFFCCTSETAIKCGFFHLKNWNVVQIKANKILFILVVFSMPYNTQFKKLWPFDWITSFHAEMKYFELTTHTTGI